MAFKELATLEKNVRPAAAESLFLCPWPRNNHLEASGSAACESLCIHQLPAMNALLKIAE
jgi:hypothetical protein